MYLDLLFIFCYYFIYLVFNMTSADRYGPPGSGKTLIARACSSDERIAFVSRSLAQLVRGEVSVKG